MDRAPCARDGVRDEAIGAAARRPDVRAIPSRPRGGGRGSGHALARPGDAWDRSGARRWPVDSRAPGIRGRGLGTRAGGRRGRGAVGTTRRAVAML
ncbi:MAG: hypothetical protein V4550_08005 [Gemmatimonadota bacterium]